jgi:PAS domain S-box-containing protein
MDQPPSPLPSGVLPQVDPMLSAAVMTARSPMVVSDPNLPDNPLVLVNPAFCRMTGYQAAELLGRNCRLLQGPQTDPESVAILRRALDARREVTVDLLNYRRNGDAFWSEVFVAPVFSAACATSSPPSRTAPSAAARSSPGTLASPARRPPASPPGAGNRQLGR